MTLLLYHKVEMVEQLDAFYYVSRVMVVGLQGDGGGHKVCAGVRLKEVVEEVSCSFNLLDGDPSDSPSPILLPNSKIISLSPSPLLPPPFKSFSLQNVDVSFSSVFVL